VVRSGSRFHVRTRDRRRSLELSASRRGQAHLVARARNGFTPASREALYKRFRGLEAAKCPFANLRETRSGRWGVGLTAGENGRLPVAQGRSVGQFEFLEWTPDNHLRHARYMGLRENREPNEARRED
jgi:bifunctional non-homologous end joining protein LigD